jgi:glycosyltransferase involved in cell wall biosynthesis
MDFALVVTSYDREADLNRFFSSVTRQSFQGHIQLIYVDQNSVRSDFYNTLSPSIQLTELHTRGRTPLSKARNIGLRNLSGSLVAFPDDDCWYEPMLLERVAAYFHANRDVDCICTNVYDPVRNLPYGKRPVGITRTVSFVNVFRFGISVGIFIRREALERAGAYFDEELGAGTQLGSGEETELLCRVLSAGCRIQYVGTLRVYHPVPEYSPIDSDKNYRYGLGFGHLNGRLLRAGHLGVVYGFVEVAVRSIVGAVVNLQRPTYRNVYWRRLNGILAGFLSALFHPVRRGLQ